MRLATPPSPVTERRFKQRYSEAQTRTLWFAFGFLVALIVLAIVFALVISLPEEGSASDWAAWEQAWDRLRAAIQKATDTRDLIQLGFGLVALVLSVWYSVKYVPQQRLVLTDRTLSLVIPMPSFLRSLKAGWTIELAAITEVELRNTTWALGKAATLSLRAGRVTRVIQPAVWIDEDQPGEPGGLATAMQMLRTQTSRQDLLETPLCSALIAAGVPIDPLRDPALDDTGLGFRLESNTATLVVAISVVSFLIYAVIDTMLFAEFYVGPPPYGLFAVIGVLAASLAYVIQKKHEVPTRVSVASSLLLGLVMAAAAGPGVLRLNALTDPRGLVAVDYHRVEGNRFEPRADSSWPVVELPEPSYWILQDGPVERVLHVRRGGLGIYQINLDNIHAELRDYFRNR